MGDSGVSTETVEAITEALADGQKIAAIKIYREATGCGLAEAKQFIDGLVPGLIEKDPERFRALSQNTGCGAAVLFAFALTGSAAAILLVV